MRVMLRLITFALLLVPTGLLQAQSRNLEIYWIDVEGGAPLRCSSRRRVSQC